MSNLETIRRAILAQAVENVGPGAEMFGNVQVCSTSTPFGKTNPPRTGGVSGARRDVTKALRNAANASLKTGAKMPAARSGMFNNVQECSASDRFGKTNPNPDLTPRQVSAVRLIVAGHSGRSTARELGVEEHAVSRWRKLPAFRAETDRQQRVLLAAVAAGRRGARG